MKTFLLHVLLACGCVAVISATLGEAAAAKEANDTALIKQVSRDMGDAMVAADIDKLNQIFADDWISVGSSGKVVTKASVLSDFKCGGDKLEAYELGPIDVQVFGNVAVAHGGVTERRNGRDTSGRFVWMDLLEKRAGKWVVVQSAGHRVESGYDSLKR